MNHQRRVVCVSDSDTRMKWTIRVGRSIQEALGGPSEVDLEVVSIAEGAVPSDRQLAENRVVESHRICADRDFVDSLDPSTCVVVVLTVGSRFHRISERLRDQPEGRPLLVTGYAGVVYEKHVEGALWRASADFVLCNSEVDEEMFATLFKNLGLDPSVLLRAGLGVVNSSALEPGTLAERIAGRGVPRTLTFAVQPDVPRAPRERAYLLERLVSYARAHPDRRVIVKLRAAPEEATTHRERFHYEDMYKSRIVDRPPNLTFEYGLMSDVLRETDVLVTVSSTAALESLSHGVPTALLTDLGIREDLGNHFFIGSGLFVSMDELLKNIVPTPRPEWMKRNGFARVDRLENAAESIASVVVDIEAGADRPIQPAAFHGPSRSPYAHARAWEETERAEVAADSRMKRGLRWLLPRVLRPIRKLSRRLDIWTRV